MRKITWETDAHGCNICTSHKTPMHRHIFQMFRGPIPEGYLVHHRCMNGKCVNPLHLILKTYSEHSSIHHQLQPPNLRLSDDSIAQIRHSTSTAAETAKQFDIHLSYVYNIRNNRVRKY